MPGLQWDIFCRVIDNFGDIGVCWRLSKSLAQRGQAVRLWVDDATALSWMAPAGCQGVEVRAWLPDQAMPQDVQPGEVVIEAFGCAISEQWIAINSIANYADSTSGKSLKCPQHLDKPPIWINLEYLSAESYVQRSHGLPSPVMQGAAKGLMKWFFYPGFTAGTGGLIRDSHAVVEPAAAGDIQRISLFCYEPPALNDLISLLIRASHQTELLVMPGRGHKALQSVIQKKNIDFPMWNKHGLLSIREQNYMPQSHYDGLLRSCDLNFVRGEDSLVRALWAGRAFVWQIYPQADGAHEAKLEAFLDWLQAPVDWREFHRVWNGLLHTKLPPIRIKEWQDCVLAARCRLLSQPDLVSQLLDFVEEKRNVASEPPSQDRHFRVKS